MKVNNIELTYEHILISIIVIFLIVSVTIIITRQISKCDCPDLQKYDNKFATTAE